MQEAVSTEFAERLDMGLRERKDSKVTFLKEWRRRVEGNAIFLQWLVVGPGRL